MSLDVLNNRIRVSGSFDTPVFSTALCSTKEVSRLYVCTDGSTNTGTSPLSVMARTEAYNDDCMTCFTCELRCPAEAINVHPFKEPLPCTLEIHCED